MKAPRPIALLLLAALLSLSACGGLDLWGDPPVASQPPIPTDNSPGGLMARGQYLAAYSAISPALRLGEPEALFYALTIRKNGLDGRAADPAELRILWEVLKLRAESMRQALDKGSLPAATRNVYRTALAQLAYFSAPGNAWPPSPPADPRGRDKALAAAERYLSGALSDFTPAMNFMAYLYLTPGYQSPSQAYAASLIAAERGDFLAMGNVAYLLRSGLGAEKNDLQAAHWARRGATSTPPAPRNQNEMGHVYEVGLGVTVDLVEAARWYGQSAAQGHPAGVANAERLKKKTPASPALDNTIAF